MQFDAGYLSVYSRAITINEYTKENAYYNSVFLTHCGTKLGCLGANSFSVPLMELRPMYPLDR